MLQRVSRASKDRAVAARSSGAIRNHIAFNARPCNNVVRPSSSIRFVSVSFGLLGGHEATLGVRAARKPLRMTMTSAISCALQLRVDWLTVETLRHHHSVPSGGGSTAGHATFRPGLGDHDIVRLDLIQVTVAEGHDKAAVRMLADDIANRTDDDLPPIELPRCTAEAIGKRNSPRLRRQLGVGRVRADS